MKRWIIAVAFVPLVLVILVSIPLVRSATAERKYVTGTHGGKYCYLSSMKPSSIRFPEYYRTLEECGKPLR